MGRPPIYSEALRRAATAIGGEANLARALSTPETQIRLWLSGDEPPPIEIYHKALDLLISTGAGSG
jgi:hypothetical protein